MKKSLSILLILALLCCCIPAVTIPVSAADTVSIASAEDFLSIRNFSDKDYVITVPELDFSGVTDFTPFDTFTGSLTCSAAGGKCVIQNLTVDCANAKTGAGLFNYLCGSVDGLIIDKSCSLINTTNAQHIGMIAGYAGVGGTISNCTNYADVSADAAYPVAGILGTAFAKGGETKLTNCVNYGNISNANAFAAGIVGMSNAANNTVDLQNCFNYGDITSVSSNAGGIIGQVGKAGVIVNCTGCVNAGTVKAGIYGGGIFGSSAKVSYTFDITKCVNYGSISAENTTGGIFAHSGTTGVTGSITMCINYGTIYQRTVKGSQSGGIAGYLKTTVNGTITIENNINYGLVSAMNADAQRGGILTRLAGGVEGMCVNIFGNVNYGLIPAAKEQTGARAGIIPYISGTITGFNINNNFADDINFDIVSKVDLNKARGTLIDDTTLTKLNELYPNVFASDDATGMITLSWAKGAGHSAADKTAVKPRITGYQTSSPENGRYNVRFVSAISSLFAKDAGYLITASYGDNSKTFRKKTTTVYQTLLATNPSGTMMAYTAPELGGSHLYALTITDIPTDIGTVTFTVQSYCTAFDGDTVWGDTITFVLNPATLK